MVHIVKIYFEDSKHEKQIRRLVVSSDVISSFKLLLEKIQNIFEFETNNLEIKWKDPENDFIHMSTDDELAQALANAEEGLLRLYISKKDDSKNDYKANLSGNTDASASDGVLHPYVMCDGCDKQIFGVRYKCLECRDFDLCSFCNLQNIHTGHDMIKFVKPTHVPREWVFTGARRLWRSMFNRCPSNYFQFLFREKDNDPQSKEAPQCSSSNDAPTAKPSPSTPKDDMETDSDSTSSNEQASSDSEGKNSKQAPRENTIPFADPTKWPGVFMECLNGDFGEAQKLIHEGLGQILKNAQVKVDCPLFKSEFNGGQPEQEKQKSRPTEEKSGNKTKHEEAKTEKETGQGAKPAEILETIESLAASFQIPNPFLKKGETQSTENAKTGQEGAKPVEILKTIESIPASFHFQVPNPFLKKGNTPSTESERAKSNEADIPKPSTDAENANLNSGATIETIVSPAEEWTFLNNDEISRMECGAQEANINNVTPERVVSYPDVMEVEAEINMNNENDTQTKDPMILSAVQAMKAMGFTNEGGWLEKLLISKQGNINEALDALYPGAHHH